VNQVRASTTQQTGLLQVHTQRIFVTHFSLALPLIFSLISLRALQKYCRQCNFKSPESGWKYLPTYVHLNVGLVMSGVASIFSAFQISKSSEKIFTISLVSNIPFYLVVI
jgi:hypothetical protein